MKKLKNTKESHLNYILKIIKIILKFIILKTNFISGEIKFFFISRVITVKIRKMIFFSFANNLLFKNIISIHLIV